MRKNKEFMYERVYVYIGMDIRMYILKEDKRVRGRGGRWLMFVSVNTTDMDSRWERKNRKPRCVGEGHEQ